MRSLLKIVISNVASSIFMNFFSFNSTVNRYFIVKLMVNSFLKS